MDFNAFLSGGQKSSSDLMSNSWKEQSVKGAGSDLLERVSKIGVVLLSIE